MLAPSSPALKEFHRLDKSSSEFQGQLAGLLSGKKYNECVSSLEGDDLVWLVDYLDKVRRPIAFSDSQLELALGFRSSRSFQHRFPEVSARTQNHMRRQGDTPNIVQP